MIRKHDLGPQNPSLPIYFGVPDDTQNIQNSHDTHLFWASKPMILFMEEILHHLGCIKPVVNNGINYLSTGFLPSTVPMIEFVEFGVRRMFSHWPSSSESPRGLGKKRSSSGGAVTR